MRWRELAKLVRAEGEPELGADTLDPVVALRDDRAVLELQEMADRV
jgi:hypothetical protein